MCRKSFTLHGISSFMFADSFHVRSSTSSKPSQDTSNSYCPLRTWTSCKPSGNYCKGLMNKNRSIRLVPYLPWRSPCWTVVLHTRPFLGQVSSLSSPNTCSTRSTRSDLTSTIFMGSNPGLAYAISVSWITSKRSLPCEHLQAVFRYTLYATSAVLS